MPKFTEQDLLDQDKRKALIKTLIRGPENMARKREAYRRHRCVKDHTDDYVIDLLLKQFEEPTVVEMQYAISNISLVRKVIDKLARVYSNGVKRTIGEEGSYETKQLDDLVKALNFNARMKKGNRYFKLNRIVDFYVRPVPVDGKFEIKVTPLAPYLYDVIPDPENEELPLAYVLSHYEAEHPREFALDAAVARRTANTGVRVVNVVQDGTNAPTKSDDNGTEEDKQEFIWWSKNYHFTTNAKGEIISDKDDADDQSGVSNPLLELPFVNIAEDRDECFWPEGGKDLIDGGIRINAFIANVLHVAITQGYGQPYMTGSNLPKSFKLGPNHCIQIEQKEGQPAPQIGFLSANPPIAELIRAAELYVALLLTTNNLSTKAVASSLSGQREFPSGIAMLIDQAESVEEVSDQRHAFADAEPLILDKVVKWCEIYRSKQLLIDKLAAITPPADFSEMKQEFNDPQTIVSEKEKLEALQLRKTLGLETQLGLIMRDNPGLSEGKAQEKLKQILEEKMANAASFGQPPADPGAQKLGPDGKPLPPEPGQQKSGMPMEPGQMNPDQMPAKAD